MLRFCSSFSARHDLSPLPLQGDGTALPAPHIHRGVVVPRRMGRGELLWRGVASWWIC